MSVYSMTGYASGQQALAGDAEGGSGAKNARGGVGMELRSVNSRFLDLSFRLADELRPHEPALRELLGQRLRRGKVELRAWLQGQADDALAEPSPRLLQRLATLEDQVCNWLPQATRLSVAEVLRLAGGTDSLSDEAAAEALRALARRVLDDFVAAREREGARLARLIGERVTQLRALARAAEPLVPQAVQAQKQRFLDRWREALASGEGQIGAEAAQERALAEATAYAIRIDVAEELGRLAAHLDEIEAVLHQGGETGKRLDFLIQELHREANTLGSKAAVLELTRISVDMKVLIEQMREQVQNIE
ncbi:MAG TPA: YicC family protein [Ottowia sp.]|uniref:YicC/YloC family endoribonuclease n=1 Tax=Ottowia sp. TaxID=1898956 RepID=UPI002BFFD1FA|nr:YicC/YloC family endoribonuclease [Ottowia sp.]HNO43420.1 YicC family protein [Ottowia sp.]HNR82718.1 YicC family protein [Ottowia sp.]HNT83741.1 YicC family protein [Ottowia sp.]HOZ93664.1 YicC family protein [Ottowia sp.]HQO52983.1 YicC family protein [Ottowia sp.]